MTMATRRVPLAARVPAGVFKAKCLGLLDQVARTGTPLIVTRRGIPIAQLLPVEPPRGLAGSVLREKDLVAPLGEAWDADR